MDAVTAARATLPMPVVRLRDRRGRGPERPCGDLTTLLTQHPTDRLDRIALGSHLIDEAHDHRLRGSSAPAKKIDAFRKISLSSSNRRTLAFNSRISPSSWLGRVC